MTDESISTKKNMIQGVSWSIFMRWILKFLGLINVAILARLLAPEDYGIVAMATLAYGLLTLFIDAGAGMLVMRSENIDDNLLNSAWTAKVIQGAVMALAILALTPVFVSYFNNEVLSQIMWVYALSAFISGFDNIGIILFRKNLQYKKDFTLEFISKVGSVIFTIMLALWLRNYWALVYGQLAGSLLRFILSFCMHSYRPRFYFKELKQFIFFSMSLIFINIGKYTSQNISLLVGGRLFAVDAMGLLNVAVNFSSIFTQEIMLPVARAMFPQYAKIKNDPETLKKAYLSVLAALALILFPVGFGVSIVSHELVAIILGDKWLSIDILVSWLAIAGILRAIIWILSGNILIVTNHENKSAMCSWLQLAVLAPTVIYAGIHWGMIGIVKATVLASCLTLPAMIFVLRKPLGANFNEISSCFIKPAVAALVMFFIINTIQWDNANIFILLITKALLGTVIYGTLIVLMWLVLGKKNGVEKQCIDFILFRLRKTVKK